MTGEQRLGLLACVQIILEGSSMEYGKPTRMPHCFSSSEGCCEESRTICEKLHNV
jgi:hypothetical protein